MDIYDSRILELRDWYIIPSKPKVKMSKGEYKLYSFLLKRNINFVYQYRHKTLKHIKSLAIDFYVIYKGRKIAIEFNGRQHYDFPNFFVRTEKAFKLQQLRDKIKMEYCYVNNIPLIIINDGSLFI